MNENPYESPDASASELVQPAVTPRRTGKKARIVFFVQAFGLVLCVITGMSETYPWLAWGEWLMPFAVTGHGFCEKVLLRQGVESVMKVAWRDGSRKTKCGG